MKTNRQGISLIVLTITIVVMIILAAAVILSINNNNIVNSADKAARITNLASAKELVAVAEAEWLVNSEDIMDEENVGSFKEYAEKKLRKEGYQVGKKADAIEVTESGEVYMYPVIPEGFVASSADTEDEVSEGLVIYEGTTAVTNSSRENAQKTRNQFVWVPVDIEKFERTEWLNNAPTGKISSDYTEPYSGITADNDLLTTGEFSEYNAMRKSVEKYGGFYIARYEAGTTTERTSESSPVTKALSKKGVFVYNYVVWGNHMTDVSNADSAVKLSREMYEENDSFATHLIYGVEWDATLLWLSDTVNVTDGRAWGNYENSIGNAAIGTEDYRTCGYSEFWKAKNIYDLAGNCTELTMEAFERTFEYVELSRVQRDRRVGSSPSTRWTFGSNLNYYHTVEMSFRPALYLK